MLGGSAPSVPVQPCEALFARSQQDVRLPAPGRHRTPAACGFGTAVRCRRQVTAKSQRAGDDAASVQLQLAELEKSCPELAMVVSEFEEDSNSCFGFT